jgi:hypothetical protein
MADGGDLWYPTHSAKNAEWMGHGGFVDWGPEGSVEDLAGVRFLKAAGRAYRIAHIFCGESIVRLSFGANDAPILSPGKGQ